MKKHHFLFWALVLLVHHAHSANEPTALDTGWFTFVSLTPTNIILKSGSGNGPVSISGPDMKEYLLKYNNHLKLKYHDSWTLGENTEFTIPLDKEVKFGGRHTRRIYTPVLLANQQKGFRVVDLVDNLCGGHNSTISHIALSDTPEEVDESKVVMILENGEWMNIGDAENLEMKQLKWRADFFIRHPSEFQPELLTNTWVASYYGPLFVEMIEKGLVTPNAEMLAALKNAGFLPSNEKLDENTLLHVPKILTQESENEHVLPPSRRTVSRSWLWWLAFPVVAGAWLVVYLGKKRK